MTDPKTRTLSQGTFLIRKRHKRKATPAMPSCYWVFPAIPTGSSFDGNGTAMSGTFCSPFGISKHIETKTSPVPSKRKRPCRTVNLHFLSPIQTSCQLFFRQLLLCFPKHPGIPWTSVIAQDFRCSLVVGKRASLSSALLSSSVSVSSCVLLACWRRGAPSSLSPSCGA